MTITYQIQFFSYWHTSSGLSGGANDDLLVMKNADDLPTIKGRTLKGLLRDAAYAINSFQENLITVDTLIQIFGQGDDVNGEESDAARLASNAGCAFFDEANLSAPAAAQLKENKDYLYHSISSTAIEASGVARTHSLRKLQVTIPLTLYAQIHGVDKEQAEALKHCFKWVKRLGLSRNRGLGYCEFSFINLEN